MDEITKEITNQSVGNQQVWEQTLTGCLLWMDDVALIHHDREELQKMLNITEDIARRYHIQFGKEKSQVITIGPKTDDQPFKIGDITLDATDTYKYLGMIINNKGNLEDHIKNTKGKVEAAFQMIMTLSTNAEFLSIEMDAIWKLIETCIIPIITYGAETWTATKTEQQKLQSILDNILKRTLKVPNSTPSETLAIETGLWSIEMYRAKKQILYYHKLMKTTGETNLKRIILQPKHPWVKLLARTMNTINIKTEDLLQMSKYQAKTYVKKQARKQQTKQNIQAASTKSKVRNLITYKQRKDTTERAKYLSLLNRTNSTHIFRVRSRMIKVKGNYKAMHTNMNCRWCDNKEETQQHILTECPPFKNITRGTEYNRYFEEDTDNYLELATIIKGVEQKLDTAQ